MLAENIYINLYLDWLLSSIACCENEIDSVYPTVCNKNFYRLKEHILQELKRYRRELRRVLDERRDGFTGGATEGQAALLLKCSPIASMSVAE